MASYLTPAQFTQIKGIFKNVTDTFGQKPIIYSFKTTSLDRFNKDREDQKTVDKTINGLIVWGDGSEASVQSRREGKFDYSKGYCLFNVQDLIAQSLIVDEKFTGKPEQDYITFDNMKYLVTGAEMVAQFPDQYVLVKIFFRKILQNG